MFILALFVGKSYEKSVLYRSRSVIEFLDEVSTSSTHVTPDSDIHPVCDRQETVISIPKYTPHKIEPFEIVGW